MRKLITSQRGSVMVLFALALTCFLGMAAIVIDVGYAYAEKTKLQNLADATALAGARELPTDPDKALEVGLQYVTANGLTVTSKAELSNEVDIEGKDYYGILAVEEDDTTMSASVVRQLPSFFGKIFKIANYNVSASAKAKVFPLRSYSGIVPFAVVLPSGIKKDETCILKYGFNSTETSGAYHGNFGALALSEDQDHIGGNLYEKYIKEGYKGPISVGDKYFTKTGNMVGPTKDGVEYRINSSDTTLRDIIVPLVKTIEVNGSSVKIEVIGFAAFHLTGFNSDGDVIGTFIDKVEPGEIANEQNYGAYAVRLIE